MAWWPLKAEAVLAAGGGAVQGEVATWHHTCVVCGCVSACAASASCVLLYKHMGHVRVHPG